jgi:short-subunit dehydrogenase
VAPFGVQVVLVEPGPIHSNFADTSRSTVERYASPDSPYAPVYELAALIQERANAAAVGPEHTSRALERAIVARRPAARYVVPFTGGLMLWGLRLLPTALLDAALKHFMGLVPGRLRARAAARPGVRLAA